MGRHPRGQQAHVRDRQGRGEGPHRQGGGMREPIWYPYPQGSVAWLKERCGCLTASRMAEAMDFLKNGKESEKRRKLKIEILAERMTDMMVSRYVTDAMEWGIAQEPVARSRYEETTGNLVELCGFAT